MSSGYWVARATWAKLYDRFRGRIYAMWFVGLCWGVTAIMCGLSALLLAVGVFGSNGAPQQAAAGAVCAAMVIVPYVFTRAMEAFHASSKAPAQEPAQTMLPHVAE